MAAVYLHSGGSKLRKQAAWTMGIESRRASAKRDLLVSAVRLALFVDKVGRQVKLLSFLFYRPLVGPTSSAYLCRSRRLLSQRSPFSSKTHLIILARAIQLFVILFYFIFS